MGNRRAREFVQMHQEQEVWRRVQSELRAASAGIIPVRGIGRCRLQLLVFPSFEEDQAWEVRERDRGWYLSRSQVAASWPAAQLVGYEEVSFPSEALASFYERIMALSLPLAPYATQMAGCDGTITQFAVFGDVFSEWRFQWWSEPPPQWRPLVAIAEEMLDAFTAAGK